MIDQDGMIRGSMVDVSDDAACFALAREYANVQIVARFTIDGEPTSKSRARFTKRGSKVHAYTPTKTHEAEKVVAWKFRQAAGEVCLSPEHAYGVFALFFPYKRQRRDVDNMLKLILDGLNGVAWADDVQVVEISGRKTFAPHADHARTEIVVYRIGNIDRRTGTCEHCGKDFPYYDSQGDRRFCTNECHLAARTAARQRTCEQCGATFEAHSQARTTRFCSRTCSDASRRADITCTECGATFTKQRCHVRARNYCTTQCRDKAYAATRTRRAVGICETCGGPTSKKTYRQCRACRNGGRPTSGAPVLDSPGAA